MPTHDIDPEVMSRAISVWPWHDAPESLRALSGHGGDEDWVALIPPGAKNNSPAWAETGTFFGCCYVERNELPEGWVVLIGAHA